MSVLQKSFLASASDDAITSTDRARMGIGACGWARSSASQENFVGIAFRDWWQHHERFWFGDTFAGFNAFASIRSEESLFACASGFADTWAQWVGIFASAITAFALTVFFIFFAFLDRWEHLERFRLNLSRAFAGFNAFSIIITEMTFFACAAGNADTWAQGVGIFARSIASFALTEFFILATYRSSDGHSFGGRHAASFRMNAHAVFVFQESGFAEATDDAIASADRARMRVGACGRASGTATEENFVFFALRQFWWISEELHGWGIAFGRWHAHATSIAQMTFITKASDDAVLGANRARVRIGAGGCAG